MRVRDEKEHVRDEMLHWAVAGRVLIARDPDGETEEESPRRLQGETILRDRLRRDLPPVRRFQGIHIV